MNGKDNSESLSNCLASFDPTRYATTRSLALFSAAIADSSTKTLRAAVGICLHHSAVPRQLYEAALQSYLFLGFPRMLIAVEALTASVPDGSLPPESAEISDGDLTTWQERGRKLCRRVYDSSYVALKTRVQNMSPEVFLWMELEGYGKVLSRAGLDIIDRELAIVSCLMMENRVSQLHSHLRGALNVGAEPQLVRDVISDLSAVTPKGHATAINVLGQLGVD